MQKLCHLASASYMSLVVCLSNDWQRMDIKYRDCTSCHGSCNNLTWSKYTRQLSQFCVSQPLKLAKRPAILMKLVGLFAQVSKWGLWKESLLNMQISWTIRAPCSFACEWRCFLRLKTVWSGRSFILHVRTGFGPQFHQKAMRQCQKRDSRFFFKFRTHKNYHQTVNRSIWGPIDFIDCIGLDWIDGGFALDDFGHVSRVFLANPKGSQRQHWQLMLWKLVGPLGVSQNGRVLMALGFSAL